MSYTDPGQPTTEDEARLLRQAMTPLHRVVPQDGPFLVVTVPVAATFAAEAAMDKWKRQTGPGIGPYGTKSKTNR